MDRIPGLVPASAPLWETIPFIMESGREFRPFLFGAVREAAEAFLAERGQGGKWEVLSINESDFEVIDNDAERDPDWLRGALHLRQREAPHREMGFAFSLNGDRISFGCYEDAIGFLSPSAA